MKGVSILIVLIVAGIFIFSLFNTFKAFNTHSAIVATDTTIEAFDPGLQKVSGFEETEKRISAMILAEKKKDDSLKTWLIVLNLLVTIATAATTLITTISTAKNKTLSFKATVAIAIIAFLSTIMSFVQGQLNTSKQAVTNKIAEIKKIRDELEALKPEELPAALPIINRKLDDL